MKKFKLIKAYPGQTTLGYVKETKNEEWYNSFPEYWEEVIERDKNPLKLEVGKEYILQYIHCESNPVKVKITRITKDGYPWKENQAEYISGIVSPGSYRLIEEVIEKDYQILSFKRGKGSNYEGTKFTKNNKGLYSTDFLENNLTEEHCLTGGFNIHSVKRLSDGEVFTVGDVIDYKDNTFPDGCEVSSFSIRKGKVFINSHYANMSTNGIEDIKHFKKPLFTTEDGVDVFEGDDYYTYFEKGDYASYCIKASPTRSGNKEGVKYFKYECNRDEYRNKYIKVLFKTECGTDIKCGDTYWCVNTAPHLWSCWEQTAKERTSTNKGVKYFTCEYRAKNYIKFHKPMFTLSDIQKILPLDSTDSIELHNKFCSSAEEKIKKSLG